MSVKSLIGPLISFRLTDSGQNFVAHARVRQLTLQSPSHKGSYELCERTEMMLVIRGCSAPALPPGVLVDATGLEGPEDAAGEVLRARSRRTSVAQK